MDYPLNTPKRTPRLSDGINDPLISRHLPSDLDADPPSYWPYAAMAALLLAGLLLLGSVSDVPNTQVGQNADRPLITNPNPAIAPPVPQ